jgi:hypothetical protein
MITVLDPPQGSESENRAYDKGKEDEMNQSIRLSLTLTHSPHYVSETQDRQGQ